MENSYLKKKRLVEIGASRVFTEWENRSGITPEEFIANLLWLCEDPCNGGSNGNLLTRELGCVAANDGGFGTPGDPFYMPAKPTTGFRVGLHKLARKYGEDDVCSFYDLETGRLWTCSATRASISALDRI